jgi:hypothetical protein
LNQFSSAIITGRNNIATPRKANDTGACTSTMGEYTIVNEGRDLLGRILNESANLDKLIAKPGTTAIQKQQMQEAKDRLKAVEAKFITHLASLDQDKASIQKEKSEATTPQQLMTKMDDQLVRLDSLLLDPSTTKEEKMRLNMAKARLEGVGRQFKLNQALLLGDESA